MTRLVELDPTVTLRDQLSDSSAEPIVLINLFHVPPEEIDAFVEGWMRSASLLKAKQGFISTKLHRGIGGSTTFLNYAVWETVAAYRAAISSQDVRDVLVADQGSGTASPHLFRAIVDHDGVELKPTT